MGDSTPPRVPKSQQAQSPFTCVILPQSPAASSPGKNLTGSPRIARDIAADLYNNVQKWKDLHIEGAKLVKQIALEKTDVTDYSPQLENYTNQLYDVVQSLTAHANCFESLTSQIRALEKLHKGQQILFISHSMRGLTEIVDTIAEAYLKEFQVKQLVLENIAHSRNKDEAMFFAACWTLQPNITSDVDLKLEVLLTETGHRKFS